jgi:hypothetical protein
MLRIWAGSVERLADNYEKALKETQAVKSDSQTRNAPHK